MCGLGMAESAGHQGLGGALFLSVIPCNHLLLGSTPRPSRFAETAGPPPGPGRPGGVPEVARRASAPPATGR